jgi:hypothetical protein
MQKCVVVANGRTVNVTGNLASTRSRVVRVSATTSLGWCCGGVAKDECRMSTSMLQPTTPGVESGPAVDTDLAASLQDRMPAALKWPWQSLAAVALLGSIYLLFSLKPIWHTDVWGHALYGKYVLSTGALPSTEPLLPLARGVPFVDTAWLSQIVFFLTVKHWGLAGLQGLTGLCAMVTAGLLGHACLQRTRSWWLAALGVLCGLWLNWASLSVLRPQLLGLVCFLVLWHRVTSRYSSRWDTTVIAVLFVIWANLHGSFIAGLGLLTAQAAGAVIDVWRRTGRWSSVFASRRVQRAIWWTEVAAVAALINPYGLGIYTAASSISSQPNLQSLVEWQPLQLRSWPGQIFMGISILLIVLTRCTPRRISTGEALVVLGLSVASLWSARFLVWWAPVVSYLLVLHLHAVWRQRWPYRADIPLGIPSGKWSVVSVGLVWFLFVCSPFGMRVLHGKQPDPRKVLSLQTPVLAVEYLQKNPPTGQVFNVYEWGDFLQWAGPPGLKVFVNSHAHLVPPEVWLHYMQVVEQQSGWEEVLDRYGVNTIILDQEHRSSLIRRLKEQSKWKVGYEDKTAAILIRQRPIF